MIQYTQETTDMDNELDRDIEYCPECGTPLVSHVEERDGGYSEYVTECYGCGYTAISRG